MCKVRCDDEERSHDVVRDQRRAETMADANRSGTRRVLRRSRKDGRGESAMQEAVEVEGSQDEGTGTNKLKTKKGRQCSRDRDRD